MVQGCQYGNDCRYSHDDTQRIEFSSNDDPIDFEEVVPSAQAFMALIPADVNDENAGVDELQLLLLGEGDFSFAECLAERLDPARIIATSLDREEDALRRMPSLSLRLRRLLDFEVQIRWGLDATNLELQTLSTVNCRRGLDKKLLQVDIPWESVGCVIWNFPFLGVHEELEKHKLLMQKFFTSLAVALFSEGKEEVLVLLTLCNDQYCRWQVCTCDVIFLLFKSIFV